MVWLLTTLLPSTGHAATGCPDVELVRTGACYATIDDAYEDSQGGDLLLVGAGGGPSSGDYVEAITIGHELTIEGVGGRPTILADHIDDGAFKVNAGGSAVVLRNLRVDGLGVNRSLALQQGELTLDDVVVQNGFTNDSGIGGGCLHGEANGSNTLTVINQTTFQDCQATKTGGAIDLLDGDLTIADGVFIGYSAPPSPPLPARAEHGGLVSVEGAGAVDISNSSFTLGVALKRAGAVYLRNGGAVDIRESTFVANASLGDRGGGAIYHEDPPLVEISDCRFEGNTTASGNEGAGAVYHRNNSSVHTRNVFCGNTATNKGGAMYMRSGGVTLNNVVFIGNAAVDGGAFHAHDTSLIVTLDHVSAFENAASGLGHALNSEASNTTVVDSALAYHGAGAQALETVDTGNLSFSAFWDNSGGDYDPADWTTNVPVDLVFPDSGIDPVPPAPGGACDLTILQLDPASPLSGAASDGGDIGAFGGPDAWPDYDGDGFNELVDCDDTDEYVFPGAVEIVGDGIDQDCDGAELCYEDLDYDGHGEPGTIDSGDGDCNDLGEASVDDDVCFPGDDDADYDGDSMPDDCDPCPLDNPNDLDNDGVCNSDDICEGFDDNLDTDGDGVPNGCDTCDSPDDTDGDGVPDDCDLCAGFDDSIDTDGDNTPDGCDQCPLDSPDDTDDDGVCDSDDPCPNDPFDTCVGDTGDTGDTGGTGPTTPTDDGTTDRGLAKTPGDDGPAGCGCGPAAPVSATWLLALGAWALRRQSVARQAARAAE